MVMWGMGICEALWLYATISWLLMIFPDMFIMMPCDSLLFPLVSRWFPLVFPLFPVVFYRFLSGSAIFRHIYSFSLTSGDLYDDYE